MSTISYSFSDARVSLRSILDTSERVGISTIRRREHHDPAAIVNARLLRDFFESTVENNVQLASEDGVWLMYMPGQSFAAEANTLDEVIADFIEGLRDYAETWAEHFSTASNHSKNWALVQLVTLSDDEQLTRWLTGKAE